MVPQIHLFTFLPGWDRRCYLPFPARGKNTTMLSEGEIMEVLEAMT